MAVVVEDVTADERLQPTVARAYSPWVRRYRRFRLLGGRQEATCNKPSQRGSQSVGVRPVTAAIW